MLGIGKIIGKFVKNSSQRELGRLNSIVQKINAFESEVKKVGNESFPAKTAEFMSKVNKKYLGTFGDLGCFSFAPNKIITTGGGGMIITNKKGLARKIKHLTTTAKLKHKWEYVHDEIGYNFRMPNLNAALGLAQFEKMQIFLKQILHKEKTFLQQTL